MICTAIISQREEFESSASLLHVVLRHNPPLEVVVDMLKMFTGEDRKSVLHAKDSKGRTPLHIAAGCEAHPMVINLLSRADNSVCVSVDNDGRTPLHLACDTSSSTIQQENANLHQLEQQPQRQRSPPSYDAIRALLSESLEASLIEDAEEMSPLEYAIVLEASMDVVNLLQKATTESSMKRRRIVEKQQDQQSHKRRRLLSDGSDVVVVGNANTPGMEEMAPQNGDTRKVSYQM